MPKETWHPSLLFSFPFLLFFFSPGIFYSLHVSSLKQSTQHRIPPLPREGSAVGGAAAFADHLFLLPPLTLWPFFPLCLWPTPSLLPAFLSGHDIEHSLSSVPAMHMDLPYPFWARTLVTWTGLGTPHFGFYLSVVSVQVLYSWSHICLLNVYLWWLQVIQRPSDVLTLNAIGRGERIVNILFQHIWGPAQEKKV